MTWFEPRSAKKTFSLDYADPGLAVRSSAALIEAYRSANLLGPLRPICVLIQQGGRGDEGGGGGGGRAFILPQRVSPVVLNDFAVSFVISRRRHSVTSATLCVPAWLKAIC